MKDQGYGQDYRYDHDFEDGIAGQLHLPEELKERRYYYPTERGYEQQVQAYLSRVADKRHVDATKEWFASIDASSLRSTWSDISGLVGILKNPHETISTIFLISPPL